MPGEDHLEVVVKTNYGREGAAVLQDMSAQVALKSLVSKRCAMMTFEEAAV